MKVRSKTLSPLWQKSFSLSLAGGGEVGRLPQTSPIDATVNYRKRQRPMTMNDRSSFHVHQSWHHVSKHKNSNLQQNYWAGSAESVPTPTVQNLAAEHFRLPTPRCGTVCHQRLRRHRLWWPSALDSRRFCLLNHILTFGWSDILCKQAVL